MISHDMHYKERTPEDTVRHALQILYALGIKVSERWIDDPVAETTSMRVAIQNTEIGTNGKGVDRRYARASGYGEFLERLENNILVMCDKIHGERLFKEFGFSMVPDERYLTIDELLQQDNAYMRHVISELEVVSATYEEKKIALYRICADILNEEGKILCIPFFDVSSGEHVYLPYYLYVNHYGSNGMSAGNSSAEAIVQGVSEIVERVAEARIHKEKPCLPEIPDEAVQKYPYIYKRLMKLRENKAYCVRLLDCSFGGQYPVAGLLILKKNTGRYGLKLGCHPNYATAIERTITEASQGHCALEYANRSIFDFLNRTVDIPENITNGYVFGRTQYPYQLFGNKPDYPYFDFVERSHKENSDFLQEFVEQIEHQGYRIYVRNNSFLSFPAYHIIIPGMSEIKFLNELSYRAGATDRFISELLEDISQVNKENCKYLIAVLQFYANRLEGNRLNQYISNSEQKLPYKEVDCDTIYFVAMCYIMLSDYKKANELTNVIERKIALCSGWKGDIAKLRAINMYLSGMCVEYSHDEVMGYINTFFDDSISMWIDETFRDPAEVLVKQFPSSAKECESVSNVRYELLRKLREANAKNVLNQLDLKDVFDWRKYDS